MFVFVTDWLRIDSMIPEWWVFDWWLFVVIYDFRDLWLKYAIDLFIASMIYLMRDKLINRFIDLLIEFD